MAGIEDPLCNSYKSKIEKEENKNIKKDIKPVVKNKVIKKKNFGKQISNSLISEEFKNVKNYVIIDVLIPAVKKAISDIITNGIDMLLYGESRSKRSSSVPHASYYRYYDREDRFSRDNDRRLNNDSNIRRLKFNYNDIIIPTRSEAEDVRLTMLDIIDKYTIVTIADFYELVGLENEIEPTHYNYGWSNLASAETIAVRDGYMIKFPKAYPID